MKANLKSGAVWLVIGAALVWIARPGDWVRPATAQMGATAAVVEWEYTSQNVDAASVQTKLNEIGSAGWEAFSVSSTDATVDTAGDGKPHVVTQRMEISAKRPKKR